MSELAFFTNNDLVAELVRRQTFLGVIVHSEDEHRGHDWGGDRYFNVHFNSQLDKARAGRLLDVVADYMQRENC